MNSITYLKLGGSLITDKRQAETLRPEILTRLAHEISAAKRANPQLHLILGHGSGSFGHIVGKRYGTRNGVQSAEAWYGFAATHDAAARLNRAVTSALLQAGVAAWSIQPSVGLRCVDGKVVDGPVFAVQRALQAGLTPLVYGDVALDDVRGGTIASTEEIFDLLTQTLPPRRMILVGEVDGVFSADPLHDPNAKRIALITASNYREIIDGLGGSHGVDVTGGMAAKVAQALELATRFAPLEVIICSGLQRGNVQRLLSTEEFATETMGIGTVIRAE